jgi:fused signal recognition particle receptor
VNALNWLVVIVVAAQVPLLGLAFLIEFSRRKARPLTAPRRPAVLPETAPELGPSEPVAEQGAPAELVDERGEREPLEPESEPLEAESEPPGGPAEPPLAASPTVETAATTAEAPPTEPTEAPEPPALSAGVPEPETVAAPELPVSPSPTVAEAIPQPPPADSTTPTPAADATTPAAYHETIVPPAEGVEEAPPSPLSARPAAVPIGLGLRRTRENFLSRIRAVFTGSAKVDEIYEGLEEALIGADVGVETSLKIVEAVRGRLKNDARPDVIRGALKDEIERILMTVERPFADHGGVPLVVLMAGVNGVGKTTTVAKLAAMFKEQHGSVIVAAADTFRAAAIEQLQVWCDRVGVEMIKQNTGSDPAAVAFDAVKAAVARRAGAVLIDTAGRLQTKTNLMEELKKIGRVVGRELPGAPHETWLVLDATTGQNALSQAKIFGESAALTGVVLAKLDSTAKGGVVVAVAERLKLPVRFVGLGEGLADLRPFDAREFVNALFSEAEDGRVATSGTYAA